MASSSEARPAKVRKLLGGWLHHNHKALSEILADLKNLDKDELQDALSIGRAQMWRSLKDLWSRVVQRESLQQQSGGAPIVLDMISLPKVMGLAAERPAYSDMLGDLWARRPCTRESP